jgi:hypothetical protein
VAVAVAQINAQAVLEAMAQAVLVAVEMVAVSITAQLTLAQAVVEVRLMDLHLLAQAQVALV